MKEIIYVPMCKNNKSQLELIDRLKHEGWIDEGLVELSDRLNLIYRKFTCLTRETSNGD